MSDAVSSNLQIAAWWITGVGVPLSIAIVGVVCSERPADSDRARWFWSRVLRITPVVMTAWLWFPWLGYGVYRISRMSLNAIDYCERPDNVIPVAPKTINLNDPKVEAP